MQEGVYLNLPEEDYFSAPALGSTDLTKLCYDAIGWWWQSKYNPDYIRDDTPATRFGKMLHAYVLEGEEAFQERFIIKEYPDFRTKEAREWKQEQEDLGKTILDQEQFNSLIHMGSLILNHPQLSGIKSGLNEVTVFWQEDEILFRARFDSLHPNYIIDFKTVDGENARGDSLDEKISWVIQSRHYDIQRAHYEKAREKMREFVTDGKVFGGTDDQLEKLKIVSSHAEWAFLWVFYQKIDNKNGKAPIVVPIFSSRADYAHEYGHLKIQTSLTNYKGYLKMFGLETPWARIESIKPITEYKMGMSYVPQPEFEPEGLG